MFVFIKRLKFQNNWRKIKEKIIIKEMRYCRKERFEFMSMQKMVWKLNSMQNIKQNRVLKETGVI